MVVTLPNRVFSFAWRPVLSILLTAWGLFWASPSFAAGKICEELLGADFLHRSNQTLHLSPRVSRAVKKAKASGQEVSQKPADKIQVWLKSLESDQNFSERDAQRLKEVFLNKYVIRESDIPESYYALQKKLARELGHGDLKIDGNVKKRLAETPIRDQRESLEVWLNYFLSKDSASYPTWAKYWALTSLVNQGTYDPETGKFHKRSRDQVAPFAELNREAFAYVVDALVRHVHKKSLEDIKDPKLKDFLETGSFGRMYGWALKQTQVQQHELKSNEGVWVKYTKGSDHMPLVQSLQGRSTGWCTAGAATAQAQLAGGDFYVFYSKDAKGQPTTPRIAIRMAGNSIAEVRGVGKGQNLDDQIIQSDVLEKKLAEFGSEGEKYKIKTAHMRRLTEIEHQHRQGLVLRREDLRFLYEIDGPIIGFGYQKDSRIREILATRSVRSDLAKVFDVEAHQISLTSEEAIRPGVVYHHGDLNLSELTSAEGLILPQHVGGSLVLHGLRSAEGLVLPQHVGVGLYLGGLTSAEGLVLPQHVGGDLYLDGLTSAEGLILPQHVGGSLVLHGLRSAEGLVPPQHVGGNLWLENLRSAKGLVLPQHVGGELWLENLRSAKGLVLPQHVGGCLYLGGLTSAQGLVFPQHVGKNLGLNGLTSAEGLVLPQHVGGELFLPRLTSAKGLVLPQHVGGELFLPGLTSAKGLVLPQHVGGDLYLDGLTSAEGLVLPQHMGGKLHLGR